MGFYDKMRRRAEDSFLVQDLSAGLPRVSVTGNTRAMIENHQGIQQYCEEEVRIKCGRLIVKIIGVDLEIEELELDELVVAGQIVSIEYLT